jgi:ferredoxin
MFRLRHKAKDCVACGICMDVCAPRAISMRTRTVRSVEGRLRGEFRQLMTFPYMSRPELCDGCGWCVQECPCMALELLIGEEALA